MLKPFVAVILSFFFVIATAGISPAAEEGNERKGKYMFRSNCRTCHKDGASAPALNPNSKTQAQWERAFEKYERLDCAAEWNKLSEQDRKDILTYLTKYAFDSPSPATCE